MTPLLLISGFLGAGKTTLLADLLPALVRAGVTPQIILNDFQNALVDAARLRDIGRAIVPVSGSCVCCGSRDEFLDALAGLPAAPKGLVLVEANGTADTDELLEMLAADTRARRFTAPAQVTVIDAQRWQRRHWNNELERAQARTATHLLLSRATEVDPERLSSVRDELTRLNPRARIVMAAELGAELVTWLCPAREVSPPQAKRPDRRDRPHAGHHVSAWDCALPLHIARAELLDFLAALPVSVLRVKGVAFLESGNAVLFQRVDPDAPATLLELGSPGGLQPVIIFIGPALDCDALEASVRQLHSGRDRDAAPGVHSPA